MDIPTDIARRGRTRGMRKTQDKIVPRRLEGIVNPTLKREGIGNPLRPLKIGNSHKERVKMNTPTLPIRRGEINSK